MIDEPVWVWGRNPVLEALRAGIALKVVVASGRLPDERITEIRQAASQQRITVSQAPVADLERLSGSSHTQGAIAQVKPVTVVDVSD